MFLNNLDPTFYAMQMQNPGVLTHAQMKRQVDAKKIIDANLSLKHHYHQKHVKLLPLPQPPVRARTDARTNPSAQRATQIRTVLARVYAVSIQNQITTTVP
jgi:hypothetical protein